MSTPKLSDDDLRASLESGHSQADAARHFGVSEPAIRFRFTYPDGKTEEGSAKAGDVMYFDAVEQLPENLGDQAFEVIAVELKKQIGLGSDYVGPRAGCPLRWTVTPAPCSPGVV